MCDKIEIAPTRWHRIKLLIAGLFMIPGLGLIAWMDSSPVFVRLSGAIVFVGMLVTTPLVIVGFFKNRPSYVVSDEGILIRGIATAKFVPWTAVDNVQFFDLAPYSRPIGKADAWGNLVVRIRLKNSSFWNRGPSLSVGEANIPANEVIAIITARFQKSRSLKSRI